MTFTMVTTAELTVPGAKYVLCVIHSQYWRNVSSSFGLARLARANLLGSELIGRTMKVFGEGLHNLQVALHGSLRVITTPVDHSPITILSSHFNDIRATTVVARYAAC